MLNLIRSQWWWMRVRVMCCQGLVLVRTLAAEFCTVQGFTWNPRQDSITVIHPGCDESTDERLCYRVRQQGTETRNAFEVVESRFGVGFDVGLEGEVGVKDDAQGADLRGWSDGTTINSDEEISNLQWLGDHNHELSFFAI